MRMSESSEKSKKGVFWNLREDNKVSESKMAVSEFKMAAIIKLSENQSEFESDWNSLSQSQSGMRVFFEWIWEKITRCLNPRWQCLNPRWQNSRWLQTSIWVRMHEWSFFVQMAEYKMAEFKMAAIIKLSQSEWLWVRLNKIESEFCATWLYPRWQNSRWLPSSS